MATSLEIITGALKHLGINTDETPLTASETSDGLQDLNDMGEEFEESLELGFEANTDASGQVNIPRMAVAMFKANLAMRIASQYSRTVSQSLAMLANDSYKRVLNFAVKAPQVQFPDTLPIGSGNECETWIEDRFFPINRDENF